MTSRSILAASATRANAGARDSDAYRGAACAAHGGARHGGRLSRDRTNLDAVGLSDGSQEGGADQRAAARARNCQLSAVTGLPALSDAGRVHARRVCRLASSFWDVRSADARRSSPGLRLRAVDPSAPRAPSTTPRAGRRACPAAGRNDRKRSRRQACRRAETSSFDATQAVARLCGSGERNPGRAGFLDQPRPGQRRRTSDLMPPTPRPGARDLGGQRTPHAGRIRAPATLLAGHLSLVVYTADRPPGSVKGAIIAAPGP